MYDAGAARIEFDSPFGLTPASGIELLGTRVLPSCAAPGTDREARVLADCEVGIGLAGSLKPQEYRDIAVCAEQSGLDAITVFGDLMFTPPALVLHTMAGATSSIRLGVAAYSPWTQHPVEVAGQIAYLDLVSNGRAFYGVVRGAWMDQLSITQAKALSAIEDTIAIVTALISGDEAGHPVPCSACSPEPDCCSSPFDLAFRY